MDKTINFSAGIHTVKQLLLTSPNTIDYCLVLNSTHNTRIIECTNLARNNKIPIKNKASDNLLKQIASINHQGIVAILKPTLTQNKDIGSFIKNSKNNLKLVILDGVQDPRNLGSCIRTALANNCDAIIIPKKNNATVNELVSKISCGAVSLLPIFEVSNIHQTMEKIKKQGVWCWGLSEHATDDITKVKFTGHTALVFGTESTGLRDLSKKTCDYLVKIPTNANFKSLNLAVSVGIATYEINKQI